MGLLDDAIREHLDLKRRRGADSDEVARQEQEALGPPRRGEFASAAGTGAAASQVEDLGAPDDLLEPTDLEADPDPLPADAGDPDVLAPPPPMPSALGGDPLADEPWLEEPDEVPSSAGLEPGTDEEDVLEETPEFLQEAPEHDRLWFEQRPPRDFDFD